MENLARSLGLGRDPDLIRLLRACGADDACVTGRASDYDRYLALAEALPLCEGHPLRESVNHALREATGLDLPLCPHTARALWDAWNDRHWFGREPAPCTLHPSCPHCAPVRLTCMGVEGISPLPDPLSVVGDDLATWTQALESALTVSGAYPVCTIPSDYSFIRPNPYHAGEALRKRADGELSPGERDLLWTQALRVWGMAALKGNWCGTLLLGSGSAGAVTELLHYLQSAKALPRMAWIPDDPADAGAVSGLYACVGTGIDLSRCQSAEEREARIAAYASAAPIGRAVVI